MTLRASPYDEILRDSARRYGVDEAWIVQAMAQQESNFDPEAVSGKGAAGIMQLMPGTAAELGVTDPMDPQQNIDAGVRYFAQMLKRYGGDVELALAAYNAGPGNVAKHGGVPPFKETQDYISRIMAQRPPEMSVSMKAPPPTEPPRQAQMAPAPQSPESFFFESGSVSGGPPATGSSLGVPPTGDAGSLPGPLTPTPELPPPEPLDPSPVQPSVALSEVPDLGVPSSAPGSGMSDVAVPDPGVPVDQGPSIEQMISSFEGVAQHGVPLDPMAEAKFAQEAATTKIYFTEKPPEVPLEIHEELEESTWDTLKALGIDVASFGLDRVRPLAHTVGNVGGAVLGITSGIAEVLGQKDLASTLRLYADASLIAGANSLTEWQSRDFADKMKAEGWEKMWIPLKLMVNTMDEAVKMAPYWGLGMGARQLGGKFMASAGPHIAKIVDRLGGSAETMAKLDGMVQFFFGMSAMGAVEGGLSYQELREQGVPHEKAAPAATVIFAINGSLEQLPLMNFLKRVKGPGYTGLLREIGMNAPWEAGTEAVQEYNSSLASVLTRPLTRRPEESAEQFQKRMGATRHLELLLKQAGKEGWPAIREAAIAAFFGATGMSIAVHPSRKRAEDQRLMADDLKEGELVEAREDVYREIAEEKGITPSAEVRGLTQQEADTEDAIVSSPLPAEVVAESEAKLSEAALHLGLDSSDQLMESIGIQQLPEEGGARDAAVAEVTETLTARGVEDKDALNESYTELVARFGGPGPVIREAAAPVGPAEEISAPPEVVAEEKEIVAPAAPEEVEAETPVPSVEVAEQEPATTKAAPALKWKKEVGGPHRSGEYTLTNEGLYWDVSHPDAGRKQHAMRAGMQSNYVGSATTLAEAKVMAQDHAAETTEQVAPVAEAVEEEEAPLSFTGKSGKYESNYGHVIEKQAKNRWDLSTRDIKGDLIQVGEFPTLAKAKTAAEEAHEGKSPEERIEVQIEEQAAKAEEARVPASEVEAAFNKSREGEDPYPGGFTGWLDALVNVMPDRREIAKDETPFSAAFEAMGVKPNEDGKYEGIEIKAAARKALVQEEFRQEAAEDEISIEPEPTPVDGTAAYKRALKGPARRKQTRKPKGYTSQVEKDLLSLIEKEDGVPFDSTSYPGDGEGVGTSAEVAHATKRLLEQNKIKILSLPNKTAHYDAVAVPMNTINIDFLGVTGLLNMAQRVLKKGGATEKEAREATRIVRPLEDEQAEAEMREGFAPDLDKPVKVSATEWAEFRRAWWTETKKIPRDPLHEQMFAFFREGMRRRKESVALAETNVNNEFSLMFERATKDLTKKQKAEVYELASRIGILRNLVHYREINPGVEMPFFGDDIEAVKRALSLYEQDAQEYQQVNDLLKGFATMLKERQEQLRSAARQIGMTTKFLDQQDPDFYFHHMVIEHAAGNLARAKRAVTKKPSKRKYQKQRKGTRKQIVVALADANREVLIQLEADALNADSLYEMEQRYGAQRIAKRLAADWNLEALWEIEEENGTLIPKKRPSAADKAEGGRALMKHPLYDFGIRQKNTAAGNIVKGVKTERLLDPKGTWGDYIDYLGNLEKGQLPVFDKQWMGFLNMLAKNEDREDEWRGQAQLFFYGLSLYENTLRQKLEKEGRYLTWRDIVSDHQDELKANIPDSYFPDGKRIDFDFDIYDPTEGQTFFTMWGLADSVAEEILAESVAMVHQESLRTVRAVRSNINSAWLFPRPMADQLNHENERATKYNSDRLGQVSRSVTQAWKMAALTSPWRVSKYALRNFITDTSMTMSFNPRAMKYLRPSLREIREYRKNREYPNEDFGTFAVRGGFSQGLFSDGWFGQELGDRQYERMLKGIKDTINAAGPKGDSAVETALLTGRWMWNKTKGGYMKRWYGPIKKHLASLEAVNRYANYKFFLEQLRAGDQAEVKRLLDGPQYMASRREFIDGLDNIEDKAYHLSNDLIGAYDMVSEAGQVMRNHFVPFWSFQEVNAKRHLRLFHNMQREDTMSRVLGATQGADTKAMKAVKAAGNAGLFFARAHTLEATLFASNVAARFVALALTGDDEPLRALEEEIPEQARRYAHFTVPVRVAGQVWYFNRLSAWQEVREWFGLQDMTHFDNLISGRRTFSEAMSDVLIGETFNKLVQGWTPLHKAAFEITSGSSLFPDVTRPRRQYSRVEMFGKMWGGSDALYRAFRQFWKPMPTKLGSESTFGRFVEELMLPLLPFYSSLPGQAAYYDTRALVGEYMKQAGKEVDSSFWSRASYALRFHKMAHTRGQKDVAEYWREEYFKQGGTMDGLAKSLGGMHPLRGITTEQARDDFYNRFLSPDEQAMVREGLSFYVANFATDNSLAEVSDETILRTLAEGWSQQSEEWFNLYPDETPVKDLHRMRQRDAVRSLLYHNPGISLAEVTRRMKKSGIKYNYRYVRSYYNQQMAKVRSDQGMMAETE